MLNRFLEERNVTKSLYIPYMTFDTPSLPPTLISDIHRYIFYMRELLENIKENNAVWALFIAIFSAPHSYYE